MPRVDFYILSEQTNREKFGCELASKIFKQKLRLHIHTASSEEAKAFDELLWTYRDISFLPHEIDEDRDAGDTGVTIGWSVKPERKRDVLINLGGDIPEDIENYSRVVEIVPQTEPYKEQARERYKQYRASGYDLNNHDLRN